MPRMFVGPIQVLEGAFLLDHEDLCTRAQDGVQLAHGELPEGSALPGDHTAALGVVALARCSQVSTTVSGFRDIDSMPSDISHSARSG